MKIVKTHIVCLDDHKTFSEEVRNRFSDAEKYVVKITHNREDLMRALNNGKETDIFSIVIMGLSDSRENIEYTDSIISDIKEYNPETAILLITPQDKTEDIRNSMKSKADTFIPRNTNTILRIHNSVKKLVSEHNLLLYTRRKKLSTIILVTFIAASLLFLLLSRFLMPGYF